MRTQGFFAQLTGQRLPSTKDKPVTIYVFENPVLHAMHVAIEINSAAYVSLVTDEEFDFDGLNVKELRNGIPAYFIPSFKEECQLYGFLNCPAIRQKYVRGKCTAQEILKIIETLTPDEKRLIKKIGQPQHKVTLYSLDIEKMLAHVTKIKEETVKWAPWAGTVIHQRNTYNCASVVMELLNVGGIQRLLIPPAELCSYLGALLGLAYALTHCPTTINMILGLMIGGFSGRIIGGAYEGCTSVQYFLNVIAREQKDDLTVVLGLSAASILSNAFVRSFLRLLIVYPAIIYPVSLRNFLTSLGCTSMYASILALPEEVLDLAQSARREERAMYVEVQKKKEESPQLEVSGARATM